MSRIVNGVSELDLSEVKARGYEIVEEIGEGHTRKAFRVNVKRGNSSRKAIMKIPLKEINDSSVCTLINASKGNLDLKEVNIANELVHPNIIRVLDSFQLSDGRTVNVEDDTQGTDLETIVRTAGAIKNPVVLSRIGNQLFDAVGYAHSKGIIHRDIKPSNFYMQTDGRGMLGDWQTAAKVSNIEDLIMPTRGGTQHAYPSLLNAVLTGKATRATEKTDVYSTATTLYYALTGQDAFDYKIVQDDCGKELKVGERSLKVKLQTGECGNGSEFISPEIHAKNTKRAISKLPAKYRSFFKRAFSMDYVKSFYSAEDAEGAWRKIHNNPWEKLKDNLIRGIKYTLPAIVASGITGGIIYNIATRDPELKPTMRDILAREDYTKFSLDTQLNPHSAEWAYNVDAILPRLEDAKKNIARAELEIKKDTGLDMGSLLEISRGIQLMDKRLVSSWVRACYLAYTPELENSYSKEGSARVSKFLVPEKFIQASDRFNRADVQDSRTVLAFGTMYLKQNLGNNKTVADVFTDYFCSREEVIAAKTRTQSQEYLANCESKEGLGTVHAGYSKILDPKKESLISTALGLYSITDEDGKIDWGKMPQKDPHALGREARLPEFQGSSSFLRIPRFE